MKNGLKKAASSFRAILPKNRPTLLQQIRPPKNSKYLTIAGTVLVAVSVILLVWIFYPAIIWEMKYQNNRGKEKRVVSENEQKEASKEPDIEYIVPVDEDFGIVIPKIEANAKIIPNVDPNNEPAYQRALTEGVAQAAGSSDPGQDGNVFVFAHSGQDLLEAGRYNAVFFLLNKLEKGDEIDIFFKKEKYLYEVAEKHTAGLTEIQYMRGSPGKKTLTLMTCWPGGTTWKRLVVIAEQK